MNRRSIPLDVKQLLFEQSRGTCAICGSTAYLEMAHITPFADGGDNTLENLMVLCPTCHAAVDSSRISGETLARIKEEWVEKGIAGKGAISEAAASNSQIPATSDLHAWAGALASSSQFDESVKKIVSELESIGSEDRFIDEVLQPLVTAMRFEGVTVLHHTGRPEHGKDLVFHERDRVGGFTFYAIVACVGKIHARSSATNDSGHYQKIQDQVCKCFAIPFEDHNLKATFHIDKVIVACNQLISDEATQLFRAWEDRERRRLIFWNAAEIAGTRSEYSWGRETMSANQTLRWTRRTSKSSWFEIAPGAR
jgi:hypothetical protein